METIKFNVYDGVRKILIKDDKLACECCGKSYQMTIFYDWSGTNQRDLDTQTTAFGESVGWFCGGSGQYVQWIGGDNTSKNGSERVDIRVDDAKKDNLWSSSYNILCFAGWYEPAKGAGPANLIVTYKGKQKTKTISPGSQEGCAGTEVATVVVYAVKQPDGSYFEIL